MTASWTFALACSVFQGAENQQVRVRVVGADLLPVPGAEVRWSTTKPERRDVARIDESTDFGLTDEEGLAVLPAEDLPQVVVASAPGLWGWNHRTNPSRPQLVVLERDGDLIVETVDPDGRPLSDVPAILRRRTSLREHSPGSGDAHAPSLGALEPTPLNVVETSSISDASGRVVLRHAHAIRAAVERHRGDHRWTAGFDALGPQVASEAELDSAAWERGTARLVVENTFELQVTFVDDGIPVRSVEQAVLVPSDRETVEDEPFRPYSRTPLHADCRGRSRAIEPRDGVALSRLLDESYEPLLRVRRNPVSCAVQARPFETARDGSRRSVRFELGLGLAEFRARVTREGAPVDRVVVSGHPCGGGTAVEIELDPPGDLRIDLEPKGWYRDLRVSELEGPREAWIRLPTLRGDGPTELGEIALAVAPLAFAGVVTDETGAPLAGVEVVARRLFEPDEVGERTRGDDPALRTSTDEQGQFALSTSMRGSFRLEFSGSTVFSDVLDEVPHGGVGLHVVLRGPARLRGHVRFASEGSAGDVEVLALRVDDGVSIERAPGVARGCSCEGLFEFENLKAGRYTLLVRRPSKSGKPVELARREGLVLAAGDTLDAGELRID